MFHNHRHSINKLSTSHSTIVADLAFVVLVFFVITTVPSEEAGIMMRMGVWTEEPPPVIEVHTRNILFIGINFNNELLIRGDSASFETLKYKVIEFVSNPNMSPELAESPRQANIYFRYERETKYEDFIKVMGSVKAAYRELWEKEALKRYGQNYSQLSPSERRFIRALIPFSFEEFPFSHCF